jgi:hypothetical protein
MPDNDDTTGFTARTLPISDAHACLEQVYPVPEWPYPDMSVLRPDRRRSPTLSLDIFGDRWSRWIDDAARSVAAPADYVVAPLLAAASVLIGHARWARAWPGWQEPPHLWCAVIGDRGKSTGADVINRDVLPIIERRIAADFRRQRREAQAMIEADKVKLESRKAELRETIKNRRSLPPQPSRAPQETMAPRLTLSDVTIERVASVLATAAPKGVLMIRDELAGWLSGMNADSDYARSFWIETYGGRLWTIDRQKSSAPIIVPRCAVSWYGGVQPGRVGEALQGSNEGLLARFMWFWPDPLPVKKPKRRPSIDWAIMAFDRLRTLDLTASDDGPIPLMVPLDDAAAKRLVRFAELMQERGEATTGLLRSAIGKACGLTLRLSMVLEYLYWCGEDGYGAPPDRVAEDTLIAAARFVSEYVIPSAERTYSDATCTETDDNTTILARWIASARPAVVHVRDMQRNVRLSGLRDAKAIHAACAALIKAGWLGRPVPGRAFQHRGTKAYPISPRLREALG